MVLLCLCRRLPHHGTEETAPASGKNTSSWDSDLETGENDSRDDVTLTSPSESNEARLLRQSAAHVLASQPVMAYEAGHNVETDVKRVSSISALD